MSSGQPLASAVGYDILKAGGNAADAAIAMAAVLAVVEPHSTGLGGDMFCLWYDNSSREVSCVNGSGASPGALTWELVQNNFPGNGNGKSIDPSRFRESALAVTVPGCAQGWQDVYDKYGSKKLTLLQILEPAIQFAEEGFPVAPITSYHWRKGMEKITQWVDSGEEAIPLTTADGIAPLPGDIFSNPDMARVLRNLALHGAKEGFYQGPAGQAIVEAVIRHGGCMTLQDLENHRSTFPEPIFAEYRDCKLWQAPPNGQGVAALIALSGLRHLETAGIINPPIEKVGTLDSYHALMEMMRLGFGDANAHVADSNHMKVTNQWLLDTKRIGERVERLFDLKKATVQGVPDASSSTINFQVLDSEGNAISFVNSNYMTFGTGIVPKGCGFVLQNRGFGFSLEPFHANSIAPNKRPFHTIIPAILTHSDTNELYASISNMGRTMQPQGHLQLTVGMLAGGLDPQTVIDMPRFCIADGTQNGKIYLEEGVDEKIVTALKRRGHLIDANIRGRERVLFGTAQIIKRDRTTGVIWAGSDGRADGCSLGF